MARLGIAGAGAGIGVALGSLVGMPQLGAGIGWTLGGLAGNLLFPDKKANDGPRLNERSITSSAFGNLIPLVAGSAQLAGEVIWADQIQERKKRRRAGKGGQPRVTEYSYTLSFAVGLCEWLIAPTDPKVLRIWLDDKLVFDATGASDVTQVPGLTWRFYPGSATQVPDGLIEAKVGADNAPAFRDLCYIVFEDLPLDPFGRRMPNVRAEVSSTTTAVFPQVTASPPASPLYPSAPSSRTYLTFWPTPVAIDYGRGRIYEARSRSTGATGIGNDELIRVYDLVTMQTIGEYPMGDMVAPLFPAGQTPTTASVSGGIMHLGVDGFLYVTGGTANRVPLWKIDPDSWAAVGVFGNPAGDGFAVGGDNGTRLVNPMQITTVQVNRPSGGLRTLVIIQGCYSAALTIDAATMTYLWGASDVTTSPAVIPTALGMSPLTYPMLLIPGQRRGGESDLWVVVAKEAGTPLRFEVTKITYAASAANVGGGVAAGITVTSFGTIPLASIDASGTYAQVQAGWYNEADGSLFLTISGGGGPAMGWSRFSTFNWQPATGAITWSVVNHVLPASHDGRGQMTRVLSGIWGLGGNFVVTAVDGAVLTNATGSDFKNLFWYDEGQAVIGWTGSGGGAGTLAKRYLRRSNATTLTVADIVGALCTRAGMSLADFDTTGLGAGVRGFLLSRPTAARDAIEVLAAAYLFDAAEIDDVLEFRVRGGTVDATIPFAEMVRETADATVVEEQRAQDADLPRQVVVRYPDIARAYEQGAQSWTRPISPTAVMQSRGVATLDIAVPMTDAEAKAIARRVCVAAWRERTRIAFSVGPEYARIVPTDVVNVTTRDGATIRARVLSVVDGANWARRVEAVTEDAAVYGLASAADGGAGWIAPAIPVPYYTRLLVPDLALVEDADDTAQAGLREYAFALSYSAGSWAGVRVFRSPDAAAWTEIGTVVDQIEWGTVTAIGAPPLSPWVWDETGSITVRMTAGEPESATDLEVLNWANLAALVGPDGQAELIQWRTATANANGTFALTGLLRGRRGTEDQIARSGTGDVFVILDAARIAYAAATTEATATRFHRAVGLFDTLETAPGTVAKAARGRAERPYAPVHLAASRDGSNNLTITWVRRTRVGGEWLDGTGEVSLGEATEAYQMDILAGAPAYFAPTYDASSIFGPGYPASNAFDGDLATFPWASEFGASTAWLRVTYARGIRIAWYGVQARNDGFLDQSPSAWTFEGWDGAAWVVLDTRTGQTAWGSAEIRGFSIATPGTYTQYRLNITAGNGGVCFAVEALILRMSAFGAPVERVNEAAARTIAVTTATATYTATQQTADWGGAAGVVFVRVYQMSNIVGRGIAAELLA